MPKFKPIHLHLLVVSCLHTTARAEWWDDFSNNLATDLAPLLALFGERVTMQYLSESTSWLDNFIFAMVPLGVVTAVVSAIRVCGGPGLRAFIGRAQEGGGIAEAELCSSTSRDVCELYHNGAIVRVFGRPKILEVVHDSKATDFYHKLDHENKLQKPRCGIYTFREYVEGTDAGKAEWQEDGVIKHEADDSVPRQNRQQESMLESGQKFTAESEGIWRRVWERAKPRWNHIKVRALGRSTAKENISTTGSDGSFAPNPNLSFNIGITKRHKYVSWVAAGIGLVVQASVILFGGLATYYWQWEKDDSRPQAWAFPLMAAGTILLSCGMFGCAFMVERSTEERKFHKGKPEGRSVVYVAQPGNQTIGDQTYDPFAFSETPSEPLEDYITSWKVASPEEDRIKVWFAMSLTVAGFGFQFTGLRSMHSSVSVVLLAAILIMSIIRSGLRTGRLKRERNLLYDRLDQVEGHELDWLSMQMSNGCSLSLAIPTMSRAPHRRDYRSRCRNQYKGDESTHSNVEVIQDWGRDAYRISHTMSAFTSKTGASAQDLTEAEALWLSKNESEGMGGRADEPCMTSKLFYYRRRLAEMTGQSIAKSKSKSSMEWDDKTVPVRHQAQQLKRAMESSARILFTHAKLKSSWRDAKSLVWSLDVLATFHSPKTTDLEQVHIFLRQPDSNASEQLAAWEIDQSSLEAVLGLWVWSIVSDPVAEDPDGTGDKLSVAAKVPRARILCVGLDDKEINAAETKLKYWAEDISHLTLRRNLATDDLGDSHLDPDRGGTTVWKTDGQTVEPILRRKDLDEHYRLAGPQMNKQAEASHLTFARSQFSSSLLRGRLLRLFGWPGKGRVEVRQGRNYRALLMNVKHPIPTLCAQDLFQGFLGAMVTMFDSIGDQTDILPVGSHGFRLTNDVYSQLVEEFQESGLGSRQDAQAIIITALGKKLPLVLDFVATCNEAKTYRLSGQRETAETILQRAWNTGSRALNLNLEVQGMSMIIAELAELYRSACSLSFLEKDMNEVKRDELRRFGLEGLTWLEGLEDHQNAPALVPVFETISQFSNFKRLWNTSGFERLYTPFEILQSLIHNERDLCLLKISRAQELNVLNDLSYENRTILSWASEKGWLEVVNASLGIGAVVDGEDNLKRTALIYAARHGHEAVVDTLIRNQAFPAVRDIFNRTPLSYASENGHVRAVERLLVEEDVDIDVPDGLQRSPLHWAAAKGEMLSVKVLLDRNAKIECYDENGQTPYITAIANNQVDMAQYLLERGAWRTPKIGWQKAWMWALRHGKWASGIFMLNDSRQYDDESHRMTKMAVMVQLMPLDLYSKALSTRPGNLIFDPNPNRLLEFTVCETTSSGELYLATENTLLNILQRPYKHVVWMYEYDGEMLKREYSLETENCSQADKVEALLLYLGKSVRITRDMCQLVAQNSVDEEIPSQERSDTLELLLDRGGNLLVEEVKAMERGFH